jgi:Arc/MetJ family transcription regulator
MKATIAIDDELFARAQEYAGVKEKSAVISEALKAFVEREAARRLARMGGSDPNAKARRAAALANDLTVQQKM